MNRTLTRLAMLAACAGAVLPATAAAAGIQGAWKVVETTTNGHVNTSPQPSLYLFTEKHFSMISVNGDKPRPSTPLDPSKASAPELMAIWGGFRAISGAYEVSGDTLTAHVELSKNPWNMASGVTDTFQMKMEGNTLTLVGGRPPDLNITKLVRVE